MSEMSLAECTCIWNTSYWFKYTNYSHISAAVKFSFFIFIVLKQAMLTV